MEKIKPFLMFNGQAEAAMNFYTGLFPQSVILSIIRYQANEAGTEGSVMHASFTLNGEVYMCIDSPVNHGFGFTPALSLYVTCETEEEIDRVFGVLSEGGSILMPLGPYPFNKKYAWLADKFGVSWQLGMLQ